MDGGGRVEKVRMVSYFRREEDGGGCDSFSVTTMS